MSHNTITMIELVIYLKIKMNLFTIHMILKEKKKSKNFI